MTANTRVRGPRRVSRSSSSKESRNTLLYHLTAGSPGLSNEDHAPMIAADGSYEAVCEAWWGEVQQDAQAEGDAGAERIVEYSFLPPAFPPKPPFDDRLALWVLTGTGKLLGSTTVSARVGEAADEDDDQDDEDESDSESEDEKPAKKKPAKKAAKKPAKKPAAKKAEKRCVRAVGETITGAFEIMEVRGRDAMMRQAERESAEDAVQEDASLRQGTVSEAARARRVDKIKRDQKVLGALYQHLLAPVEAYLEGATEVLIIPHKELFEVPWAALFDSRRGQYLIERYVLRVAPSLRVARTAADTLRDIKGPKEQGHALVVGNPLPTRSPPLCGAEEEAELVSALLMSVGFKVHVLMREAAGKAEVQGKIEGATWGHFACHGAFGRKALLMLAESPPGACVQERGFPSESPAGSQPVPGAAAAQSPTGANEVHENVRCDECALSPIRGARWKCRVCPDYDLCDVCYSRFHATGHSHIHEHEFNRRRVQTSCGLGFSADLTMEEVQGSVRMGMGSTVVLSACNSGLGEIRAEGVASLSRSLLFAGAAATVVSLWSVDDGSTSALMDQMYKHLMDGRTTAQALRLAMLHLLHGPAESGRGSRWRRPLYWAAFLVVGANTRLPGVGVRGDMLEGPTELKPSKTFPGEKKKTSGISSGVSACVSQGMKLTLKKKEVKLKRGMGEEQQEEDMLEGEASDRDEEEE